VVVASPAVAPPGSPCRGVALFMGRRGEQGAQLGDVVVGEFAGAVDYLSDVLGETIDALLYSFGLGPPSRD
jgi:hypothetical protein